MSQRFYDQHPPDRDFGPTVLIVDDEELGRRAMRSVLAQRSDANSIHTIEALSVGDALHVLASTPVHVVLLDKNLGPDESDPAQNGIDSIPRFLNLQPHLQILVVTGSKSIEDAVRAMRLGACGYVTKESPTELKAAQIETAIRNARIASDNLRRTRLDEGVPLQEFGGKSFAIRQVLSRAELVAQTDRPVLLLGETGTGKSTIAKLVHEYRKTYLKQNDRPFFSVDVGALKPELVERDLFGNEVGAFTGAVKAKQGFFELANTGTIFLDEIGEASPDLQLKLLKVLDDGTFYRLGGTKEMRSSFKLICATNRNLEQMVRDGTFRQDLYMRISTFPITVPSLKERSDDISEILRALLPKACRENKVQVSFEELPEEMIEYLVKNPPEGNIRGLDHFLSRVLVLVSKDRAGKPLLSEWKRAGGVSDHVETARESNALTLNDLLNRDLDLFGPEFPGFVAFMNLFEKRIFQAAARRFSRNIDIARALKLSEGATSLRLSRMPSNSKISRARPKRQPTDRLSTLEMGVRE